MSVIEVVSVDQYESEMDGRNKFVFIDFYATWCGPCKAIEPKIHEFSKEYDGVKFLKINVDKFKDIMKNNKVRSLPTFILFENSGERMVNYEPIIGNEPDKVKVLLNMVTKKKVIGDDF